MRAHIAQSMESDKPESAPASAEGTVGDGSLIARIARSEEKRGRRGGRETKISSSRQKRGLPDPEPAEPESNRVPDLFDAPSKPMEVEERSAPQVSNQRRGSFALRVWLGSAISSALVVGAFAWFMHHHYLRPLDQVMQNQKQPTTAPFPAEVAQSLAETSRLATTNAADLTALQSQINALGGQFNLMRQDFHKLRDDISKPAPSPVPQAPPVTKETDPTDLLKPAMQGLARVDEQLKALSTEVKSLVTSQTAAATKRTSPAGEPRSSTDELTNELVLLKERNRLTLLADEVMATGRAEPMRRLWASLRDPDLSHLKHAAAAEIIRVQNHLDRITRLRPDYRMPVSDYFPQSGAASDDKLEDAQLVGVLLDQEKPLQSRARAAVLLTGRRTPQVGDALITAMRTDPELDVAKECQHALHNTFGFSVPLFDTQSAEEWWNKNRDSISKAPAVPATAPPAPAP